MARLARFVTRDDPPRQAETLASAAISGTGAREAPYVRPTARVILLDGEGRTLLFSAGDPDDETGRPFWFAPGGGLEPGESHEEAAFREVFEETGIRLPALGPCIWLRTHRWRHRDMWYISDERYFVADCTGGDISRDGWTDLEVQAIRECRWWTHDAIHASPDIFVPRQLDALLPALLRHDLPSRPLVVE